MIAAANLDFHKRMRYAIIKFTDAFCSDSTNTERMTVQKMSNNKGFEIDGGWVGTAIVLGICLSLGPIGWFIGALVLKNKLKDFKRGRNETKQFNKIGTSLLVAGLGMTAIGLAGFGLPVAIAGGVVLWYGKRAADREQRYRRYLAIIGGKSFMPILDIARTARVPIDQVKSELQSMIDLGYFGVNTYIDARTMCIVIDSRAAEQKEYHQQRIYVDPEPETTYAREHQSQAEAAWRAEQMERERQWREQQRREQEAEADRRAAEAAKRAEEAEKRAAEAEKRAAAAESRAEEKTRAEQKKAMEEEFGSEQFAGWILSIREVNDRIDDKVISDKIDRIEMLTRRIFEMVRTRPEKEGQIRKFMNYYLPTTLKLLDSYAMLEAQGIEGENISAAKQKIEGIMDTLIEGFEKQLDLLFSAQAMDINSDIQVLESMMAADGLKENEFKLKRSGGAGK